METWVVLGETYRVASVVIGVTAEVIAGVSLTLAPVGPLLGARSVRVDGHVEGAGVVADGGSGEADGGEGDEESLGNHCGGCVC